MELVLEKSINAPNNIQRLTLDEVKENKKCFDKVNGPLYFLGKYCYVNCGQIIPYELRPYATELIYCLHNFNRGIFMCGRQQGKCFQENQVVRVKNKKTGEIKALPIKEFYALEQNKNKNFLFSSSNKFIVTFDINDWEIETDTGWENIVKIHKTIEYDVWKISTKNHTLECADNHIVFDNEFNELFVKDIIANKTIIKTDIGEELVLNVKKLNKKENMYDLELPIDSNKRYYTNGILSHNTTTACLYILWYCMFNKDKQALLTSYNYDQTVGKNMATIKTAYEYCPAWLKPGIEKWNEQSIKFDNGSEIIAKTTTEDCVRGTSPNIIYCDELAFTFKGNISSQKQFYTSISPALSASKGKLFITSTPQSEFDQFANIWKDATRFTDDDGHLFPKVYVIRDDKNAIIDLSYFTDKDTALQYVIDNNINGIVTDREGLGYNGFASYLSTWRDVADRTEEWARLEKINMGEQMFEREYNCLDGDNCVTIRLENGEIRNVSLKNLYNFYNCF